MKQNKRRIGSAYEDIAASYLLERGYAIVERNYRNLLGELDIIAEKDNVIVYIEIKYRASKQCGDPLEAVDYHKQRRISRIAACHYAEYGALLEKPCRFDVIGIDKTGKLSHIENAFEFHDF